MSAKDYGGPRRTRPCSPTREAVKTRAKSLARALQLLEQALAGKEPRLNEGDPVLDLWADLGIPELLSMTAAKKRGLELKARQKPFAHRYYGAPISQHHPVFGVWQFKPPAQQELPEVRP